jgi:hypothetical protein
MTNTYNTLNPLGSTSAKDLSDNASNFDEGMNSLSPSFYDRFKRRRETWAGMEKMVADFLEAMGFEATHLVYVDGSPLTVLRPTQLIDRAGSVYKVKAPAVFPVMLTGTWATDQNLLVDVGDASLRMSLAASTGATLVGYGGSTVASTLDSLVAGAFGVNVKSAAFGAVGDGVADDTAAIQAAYDSLTSGQGTIYFPAGIYNYTALNFDGSLGLHIVGEGAIATTILRCTSTLATDGIKFRSTFDCTASFITFDHSSASFTGYLTDMRHKPVGGIDTQGMYFFRCTFASQGYDKYSAKGACLDQATLCTFEGCKFVSLLRPIDGQNPLGGGYSNGMRFKNCQFADNVGYNFNYLGEQWSFDDCNFQASHGGAQLICFSDNTTSWRGLAFKNCGVYDAIALGASMLNLGTGSGLTVENGLWGGRGDLGSTTWLNATGTVTGVNVKGTTFSMFTNIAVAGAANCLGWNISGGNIFIPITGQPITSTVMLSSRANAPDAKFDGNVPNVSLRDGTGSTSNWRSYNPDGTCWIGGQVTSVGSGATGTLSYPLGAVSATLHVSLGLKSPATTSNVVSEVGDASGAGFQYFINGSGSNTLVWSALVRP